MEANARATGVCRFLWDEPLVIVPGRMASPLYKLLREALATARREGRSDLDEFEQLMNDLMAASLAAGRNTPSVSDHGNTVTGGSASGELLVVEAAALLGRSARRICQLLDNGQLTGRRSGGIRLVDIASIEALKRRSHHGESATGT